MPIIPSNKSDFFNRTFSKKVKSNNRIIHWWQKITFSDQTTTTTATPAKKKQDWRHLSPNRPPLPFLYSLSQATSNRSVRSSPGSCNTVQSSIKLFDKISETEAVPSELAPIFKELLPSASLHAFSSRDLYTIPESSEINTATTNTTVNTNNSSVISTTNTQTTTSTTTTEEPLEMGASQLINKNISVIKTNEGGKDNDSLSLPREYKQESSSNNSKPIQISNRNDQDSLSIRSVTRPSTSRAMILVEDDDEEQDVNNQEPFIPVFDWPASNIPCEPLFGTTLEGNETLCKIRFCNMLTTAYQQYQQRRNDCPQQMCILFDKKDNIKGISIILQNGSREDYLEFEGSIQYIPPELSICATYHDEQADIWALGISLYRMLVGKYPFHNQLADAAAVSHQDVFKKMFKYDFVIPKTLSPDARDLIQRMLAPEKTRASFDLVMFHPWLKSYIFWPDQSIKVSENTKIFSKKPKNKSKTKEAKKVMRAFRKAILFIIKGPHPPPASYYDLVNKRHRQ